MWMASSRRADKTDSHRTVSPPARPTFDAFLLSFDQDEAIPPWVHAWLNRIEGDLGNADCWYRVSH